mmetsp:Transcript_13575/g.28463  ORF Transcript_13575/g.28463 Transcript_13575/m.28463 type:complete len:209 (+) Transcript_13575:466-1092(+)
MDRRRSARFLEIFLVRSFLFWSRIQYPSCWRSESPLFHGMTIDPLFCSLKVASFSYMVIQLLVVDCFFFRRILSSSMRRKRRPESRFFLFEVDILLLLDFLLLGVDDFDFFFGCSSFMSEEEPLLLTMPSSLSALSSEIFRFSGRHVSTLRVAPRKTTLVASPSRFGVTIVGDFPVEVAVGVGDDDRAIAVERAVFEVGNISVRSSSL